MNYTIADSLSLLRSKLLLNLNFYKDVSSMTCLDDKNHREDLQR